MSKEIGGYGEKPQQKKEVLRQTGQIPRIHEGGDGTSHLPREVFSKEVEGTTSGQRTPEAIITEAIGIHGKPNFAEKTIRTAEIPIAVGHYNDTVSIKEMMDFQKEDTGPHEVYEVLQPITEGIENRWIIDPTTGETHYRRINEHLDKDSGWNPATEDDQYALDKILRGIEESL